ncbi:MAG: HlyD family efflux transporter periplasmic adaptor subunit [Lachnospiraceae bacterium]|nr:HlyD family efflux transporter periplasmic adaptor subunit [Lachnospiraceae bacterium]
MKLPHIKKKYRKFIWIGIIFLALVAAACYTVFIKPNLNQETWVYKEAIAEKGDLTVGVTESGTLEYGVNSLVYDLDLSTEDNEDDDDDEEEEVIKYLKVENINVVVGQRITEGDALLTFTQDSIDRVRRKLQAAITEAEIVLEEAQSEYQINKLTAKQTYDSSILDSSVADSVYNATVTQLNNQISVLQAKINACNADITKQNADMDDASDAMGDAAATYSEWVYKMEDNDGLTDNVNDQISYLNAKNNYENALQKIQDMKDQIAQDEEDIASYQEEIADIEEQIEVDLLKAEQSKETAVSNGSLAQSVYDSALESAQTAVNDAQDDLDDLNDKLEDFEAFVGDGTVYAEDSGIVTTLGVETGDTLDTTGTEVVAYATEKNMTLSVDVSEEDIVSLSLDDPVTIVFTAYDDREYTGHISSITTSATSEHATTVSYPVEIEVEGDTTDLYGGMTADVTFITDTANDVVYVSQNAIVSENDKNYVYVDGDDGEKQLKEVITGMSNGVNIVITDGLIEGDVVYVASRVSDSVNDTEAETENGIETTAETQDAEGFDINNQGSMSGDRSMPGGTGSMMPGGMGGPVQ